MPTRSVRVPHFLFVNENIGGHRTVHRSLRRIFAERDDVSVEFIDGGDPGLLGRILRAPVPLLGRLDLDLQPLRGQLVHSFNMRRQVRRRLARGGVDAMHVYTQNCLLGSADLLRSTPSVITTDSTGRLNVFSVPYRTPTRFTGPMSRANLIFERPVLDAAKKVFACSRAVEQSLASPDYEMPPQQVERLELGVHSPYFARPLPPRDPARRPTIVFVGTSLERKGGTLLLDVWRDHLRDRADLTLITLESLPPEEGLTVINDLQPGEDRLWDILAAADIFCLPSLIDQAPNAILEAMAAGLPVVAHPNGAIPEMVVDGETGLLVDARTAPPVAEALGLLVDDPDLRARMGAAGWRHAKEHYDMTASADTILEELSRAAELPPTGGTGTVFALHREVDEELLREWWDLAERRSTRFSSRPSYALTWFRTLGKGRLSLATVHRDGRLVALLPLHTRSRLGVTVHRLAGHGLGTVGEALAEDDDALCALVEGLHDRHLILSLTHLPEDSPFVQALLDHGGWTLNHELDDICPVTDLPPGTTARDLRSGRSLKRLRSARNRAGREQGEVTFGVAETPEEFARAWPEIVQVAALAEQQEKECRLNLTAGVHGEFTRAFLAEEAERGNLRIVLLRVSGRLAAFDVLLRSGSGVEGWLTRFDPEYRALSVGHQLIEHSVNDSGPAGITAMDHMIGRSEYKDPWATYEYRVGTVTAAPWRVARPALTAERAVRRLSEWVHARLTRDGRRSGGGQ